MSFSRRKLITGSVAAVGAGVATGYAVNSTVPESKTSEKDLLIPFYGKYQSGILAENQRHLAVNSYRVIASNKKELQELLKTITERAALTTSTYTPKPVGITAPPSDNGILGPEIPGDDVTVTVGLGNSLFDNRFGISDLKPKHLTDMKSFPNDDLNPDLCGGDLMIEIRANHHDAVLHTLRDINLHTRGAMQLMWRKEGYLSIPRPKGIPRNHFGFNDGIANPDLKDPKVAEDLLWSSKDDLPWTKNGSYFVVRLIPMLTEFWDRISISEQQNIFGRNRDNGAPLDGSHQNDIPDYLNDPVGAAIPLNAHIRLANPRTPDTYNSQIFRRAYNYSAGTDSNGNLNLGLIFTCYQQNIERQFEATQQRLVDEPLVDYIIPIGGGYFFLPPGVNDSKSYIAEGLFNK